MSENVVYLIVYVALWVITFIIHQKKKKYFGASSFVVLLYLFIASFSLIAYVTDSLKDSGSLTLFPFIYLYFCVLIACIPVFKYNELKVDAIIKPSFTLIQVFTIIYLIASFFVTIDSISNIAEGAANLLMDDEAGAEAYMDAHDAAANKSIIISLFSIVFNIFSDAAIIIFFYYLIYYPQRRVIIILFAIGILVQLLGNIAQGLRTGTVLKSLSLIVAYIALRRFMKKSQRRFFTIAGIVLGLFVVALIVSVSISRFGDKDENLQYGTIGYVGQGNTNFNQFVLSEKYLRNGDRTANGFKRWIGLDPPEDVMKVRSAHPMMKINDGSFSTFVGDFVLDYGPYLTVLLFIIFAFVFSSLTRARNRNMDLGQLILLFFCMNVVTHGSFYLFSYSFKNNITILGNVFMFLVFHFDAISKSNRGIKAWA